MMERWQVMWLLAFAIFCGCKLFTWFMASKKFTFRDIAYLALWTGLDAQGFIYGEPPSKPTLGEWAFAWTKLLLGVIVFYGIARLIPGDAYWVGWVGMIGIAMILHFGIFHILSCFWRRQGFVAKPLMNYPLLSVSLSDFWGKRWNTAFRDITHRYLFRPLTRKFGGKTAVIAGFVTSGLVHDLVISVPAGGGYGKPTVFFLIQAVGMMAERSRGVLWLRKNTFLSWLYTAHFIVVPSFILFHRPFVVDIVVPFMRAAGAIR